MKVAFTQPANGVIHYSALIAVFIPLWITKGNIFFTISHYFHIAKKNYENFKQLYTHVLRLSWRHTTNEFPGFQLVLLHTFLHSCSNISTKSVVSIRTLSKKYNHKYILYKSMYMSYMFLPFWQPNLTFSDESDSDITKLFIILLILFIRFKQFWLLAADTLSVFVCPLKYHYFCDISLLAIASSKVDGIR